MSTPTVRLAIGSPIVTSGAPWANAGSIEDLARIAEAGDRLGYHHLTCSEHIALPAAELDRRGAVYWDPLATFGYLAARTERIRFATHVLVLPYHHPLEIAKRYGTLDRVSNGRVILGVGVGTLKEEFDLIGAPFDDRGPRSDDALKALRASLSVRDTGVPRPVLRLRGPRRRSVCGAGARADLGRRTDASLAPARGRAHRRLVPVRGAACSSRRVAPARRASVRLRGGPPADRAARPRQRTREDPGDPGRHRGAGATIILSGFASESLAHYLEQLEALAAVHATV